MLEIRDLRLVVAIDGEGGMTRAGAVLNLTQSALSHQLADLERRLGTRLFLRQGRRMVLTPAGERFRDAAKPILAASRRLESEMQDAAQQRSAILRFSTECYTCYHWLPAVLREYRVQYPQVEPRLVAQVTRRPLPALVRGDLDLAIINSPVRDRRISVVPLFRDEMVAVVAPDHPWARRRFVDAEDFADQHLLSFRLKRSESTLFTEVLEPAGISPRQVSHVELTEAILELARAGLGVAVLARWAVSRELEAGALRAVRVTSAGIHRQWSAATLRHKVVPAHLTAFVELIGRTLVPKPNAELKLLRG